MIGTMEFIKCAGSLATAEYPLIASDDEMDTYVVKTYTGVQFVEDLQQSIVMPSFDGWSECNMVRFTQTNQAEGATAWKSYYWITNAVRSSDVDGCTTFYLEFDAVTTLLKKGSKVNGQWIRSPVNYTPWKQQNVISGTMQIRRRIEFPSMPANPKWGTSYDVYWVSITATKNITKSKQGCLMTYGFPVYMNSWNPSINLAGNVIYRELDNKVFPSINDILSGDILATTGLTADEVTDISITRCAPGTCTFTANDNGTYEFDFDGRTPTWVVVGDTANYYMYEYKGVYNAPLIEFNLSAMELTCGQLAVLDTNGSTIGTIPTNWTFSTGGKSFVIRHQLIVDYAQIYERIITFSNPDTDLSGAGVVQIPGAHIPYVGSSWDTYKAYSMSFDRESMEFGIDQAKQDRDLAIANAAVGTVANLASGNVSGAIDSAAGGVNAYYQQVKEEKATRFNQDLSERRVQAQPGTGYNVNYGLSYLYNEITTPACIAVLMPSGLTEDIFNEYIEDYGYANEGEYEQTMQYGFYQGTVYTSPTLTGPRFDGLINSFNAGIRLISPAGNQ